MSFSRTSCFLGSYHAGNSGRSPQFFFLDRIRSKGYSSLHCWIAVNSPKIVSNERNECGMRIEQTCNMSSDDCCRYTGICGCGRQTPPNSLECVDCRQYRGWFR